MKFSLSITLLSALSLVAAHGTVANLQIGGKNYTGPDAAEGNPFRTTDTPVRQLALLEPINDITSEENICGRGAASSAKLVAPVSAGSSFSFSMRGGSGAHWPHNKGPVLYYLAKCPGSAADCNPANLKFFKVGQLGLKPSGQNAWWQEDLYNGGSVSGDIPKKIDNGDYLLRIEILALHNAMNVGGAESTVSCSQIRISGGSGGAPSASQLVKFPAYKKTDKGIHIDIWNGINSYSFPGPALFTGGSSSNSTSSTSVPINAAPAPTKTTLPVPSTTKVCRRHRSRRAVVIDGATLHRRAASRVHGSSLRYAANH
ncbi:glycosyl hydrolase family 61-domain-containing protein [Auriculariales sp. MPI-PUGE-AT-0066]|nr:glycosyl hydrolase family 61-domain-containing protein [Auriculariales sp. MPI-PUGE-AT-0066]